MISHFRLFRPSVRIPVRRLRDSRFKITQCVKRLRVELRIRLQVALVKSNGNERSLIDRELVPVYHITSLLC
jgi:hypothetical protein